MVPVLRRSVTVLAAVAAATALVSGQAHAYVPVTPAAWTPGYAPQGCTTVFGTGDPTYIYVLQYTDTGLPQVEDIAFEGGGTTITVPPAGKPVNLVVHATETCSGVLGLGVIFAHVGHNSSYVSTEASTVTPDPFNATLGGTLGLRKPSFAGAYHVPLIETRSRYSAFTLTPDFALDGTPTSPSSLGYLVGGPWMSRTLYVLAQATLVPSQTAMKVVKGKPVTFTAMLSYATDTGFVADNGEKALVQTKVGKAAWKTRATVTADSAGRVTYTFKPTTTTAVRFVHAETHAGRFTSAVTSAVKAVKVG
jgi:hypothetical protein